MKRIIIYILSVIYISISCSNFALASEIFINSPELSHLKKVKNIKNKKGKRNKDGMIYVGQKGLLIWNGYGILRFKNGDIFAGKFVVLENSRVTCPSHSGSKGVTLTMIPHLA